MKNISDRDIIDAVKSGDNSRYIEYMYERMYPKIKKLVYDGGGTLDDAKDILQESVIIFFKQVKEDKYRQEADLDAYLYTVAKNLWINKAKISANRRRIVDTLKIDNTVPSHVDAIYSKERANKLRVLLDSLGDRCKELLMLIYYEDKSMKEVCVEMGFSSDDVAKTKHYKCKQRLTKLVHDNIAVKDLLIN